MCSLNKFSIANDPLRTHSVFLPGKGDYELAVWSNNIYQPYPISLEGVKWAFLLVLQNFSRNRFRLYLSLSLIRSSAPQEKYNETHLLCLIVPSSSTFIRYSTAHSVRIGAFHIGACQDFHFLPNFVIFSALPWNDTRQGIHVLLQSVFLSCFSLRATFYHRSCRVDEDLQKLIHILSYNLPAAQLWQSAQSFEIVSIRMK